MWNNVKDNLYGDKKKVIAYKIIIPTAIKLDTN